MKPSAPPPAPKPVPAAAPKPALAPKAAPAKAKPKAKPPVAEQKKKGKGCGGSAAVLLLAFVAVVYWMLI
jgi:hypothetical protein